MWTPAQRRTLEAAADIVVPPDPETPGASQSGVAEFMADLFDAERTPDRPELLAFLERIERGADPTVDPWFPVFAEIVHEHYWTSDAGLAAVGFTVTDPDALRADR